MTVGNINPKSVLALERALQREFYPVISPIWFVQSYYGGCDTIEIKFWFSKDSAASTRQMALTKFIGRLLERDWEAFHMKSMKLNLRKKLRKTSKWQENSQHGMGLKDDALGIRKDEIVKHLLQGCNCGIIKIEAWLRLSEEHALIDL